MNKDEFKGNWKQIKGKIKEQWGKLTDDDITRLEGNFDQFTGLIQKRYGYEKERAEREIRDWKLKKEEHERERKSEKSHY